ncbi:RNA polymerase sigma factor [Permianibacter sp. IMCC34836]|uniref:RNA polymerase sigma factor n=1 Tax=Permianibacter fluminis TaxID=2738515 RepID=UPI001557A85A|nr:RNA polymerase sigma factor [Permianibacter fluminis]NQD36531.1 RNA polymerase sigma factor [Permianibacter fluminis]
MDESKQLELLRQQDKQAFAALVRAQHGKLKAVARAMVGSAEAEEVVQEAWLSAWRALPAFEGRSSLKTWLTRIVMNAAHSRLRRRDQTLSLDQIAGENPSFWDRFNPDDGHWQQMPISWRSDRPDGLLQQTELGDCLQKNLDRLPALQQAVFTLRHVEELELDDICNELNVSASNVRVLLHRARLKLFQVAEHYQETGEC